MSANRVNWWNVAALCVGLVACSGAPKPRVLFVAASGQFATYPPAEDDEGRTMIAPLGCKAGVGEACLQSVRERNVARSSDGRPFRLGRRTRAWNCDTHDGPPEFYATFESDIQLPEDGDQLLVMNGESPLVLAPGSSAFDVDLDGDGVVEHVAVENRNTGISITNGKTGVAIHVPSASGLSIVHLVGAAPVKSDATKDVIFREGRLYRAVGADGHAFDLGFGCTGA